MQNEGETKVQTAVRLAFLIEENLLKAWQEKWLTDGEIEKLGNKLEKAAAAVRPKPLKEPFDVDAADAGLDLIGFDVTSGNIVFLKLMIKNRIDAELFLDQEDARFIFAHAFTAALRQIN